MSRKGNSRQVHVHSCAPTGDDDNVAEVHSWGQDSYRGTPLTRIATLAFQCTRAIKTDSGEDCAAAGTTLSNALCPERPLRSATDDVHFVFLPTASTLHKFERACGSPSIKQTALPEWYNITLRVRAYLRR